KISATINPASRSRRLLSPPGAIYSKTIFISSKAVTDVLFELPFDNLPFDEFDEFDEFDADVLAIS
ncbi:MAG: hypothetical protein VW299_09100, partial [Alphaproteobacteria bacterium]